jgi:hypothetical protein
MKRFHIVLVFIFSVGVTGCAPQFKSYDYSVFHAEKPRSILVVPILNESVEVYASNMLVTSVAYPLGERGYYVFPVMLTDALLKDLGLPEAGLIHQLPPRKFYEHFGCDAVLFITIKDWASKFVLIQNTRYIKARYLLVNTHSGNVLWDHTQEMSLGSGDGGGGLLGMVVAAVVDKVMTESFDTAYRDVARITNSTSFNQAGFGLPAGPYNQKYGMDQDLYPDKKNP